MKHTDSVLEILQTYPPGGLAQLSREREAIDKLIDSDNPPAIYGFTTLLGHLDNQSMTAEAQQDLLQVHLVGPEEYLPASYCNLLAVVKTRQLLNGGTGVSPEAFSMLSNTSWNEPVGGNWLGSYGSGDVVPGAWFVKALMQENPGIVLKPGDLIAFMSGNFSSVAVSIVGSATMDGMHNDIDSIAAVVDNTLSEHDGSIQRSVSTRDMSPMFNELHDSSRQLKDSIIDALQRQSGNPLFVVNDEGATPVSNSSFLDFNLRASLIRATHATAIAHTYLLGMTRSVEKLQSESSTTLVQPTKIMSANHKRLEEVSAGLTSSYSIVESGGVEDVCDLTIHGAMALLKSQSILRESIEIMYDVLSVITGNDIHPVEIDTPSGQLESLGRHLIAASKTY